jgi:hypothetical protein
MVGSHLCLCHVLLILSACVSSAFAKANKFQQFEFACLIQAIWLIFTDDIGLQEKQKITAIGAVLRELFAKQCNG